MSVEGGDYLAVKHLLERELEEARIGRQSGLAAGVWAEAYDAIAVLLEVLSHHYPAGGGIARLVCSSCEELKPGNRGTWPTTWPCPTFTALEKGAGRVSS